MLSLTLRKCSIKSLHRQKKKKKNAGLRKDLRGKNFIKKLTPPIPILKYGPVRTLDQRFAMLPFTKIVIKKSTITIMKCIKSVYNIRINAWLRWLTELVNLTSHDILCLRIMNPPCCNKIRTHISPGAKKLNDPTLFHSFY